MSKTVWIRREKIRISFIIKSFVVGIFAGLITILYRWVLGVIGDIRHATGKIIHEHPISIILWVIGVTILGCIVGYIIKKEPLSQGSGIPQIKGEVINKMDGVWYRVIIAKFIGGALSIFGGLSLGREGPAVQIGGMIGKNIASFSKADKKEEQKIFTTCGAAAGLSAAFNAPLASVLFVLEEMYKGFSIKFLVASMIAALTADTLSNIFLGMGSIFTFTNVEILPMKYFGLVIILGLIAGVAGVIYNRFVLLTQIGYEKILWLKPHQKVIIPFLLTTIFIIFSPEVLGGGYQMIAYLEHPVFTMVIVLFVLQFAFTIISFASGAPGGIFFPMLIIGMYIGYIFGAEMQILFQIDEKYLNTFIILAMAAFFTAIVRSPITGIILISEMTGRLVHLLPLSLVVAVAYITAERFNSKPIYDSLLERMLITKISSSLKQKKYITIFLKKNKMHI